MSLIQFTKKTIFMDKYIYEEGVTYQVPKRLEAKFCNQMGVAVTVKKSDSSKVQPNPSAEMYNGEDLVAILEPTPVEKVEEVPEAPAETASGDDKTNADADDETNTDPQYELKGKGGPWWDVIDVATGAAMNEKALKKDDAEALLNELSEQAASTTEE